MCQQLISYIKHRKKKFFFHVCCYSFSQGFPSMTQVLLRSVKLRGAHAKMIWINRKEECGKLIVNCVTNIKMYLQN